MSTVNHQEPWASEGAPLAVCVNDCQIDHGQPSSELARICFNVGCAFAEMRWGRSAARAFRVVNLGIHDKEPSRPS